MMKKAGFILIPLVFLEILLRFFYNPPSIDPRYNFNSIQWLQRYVSLNGAGYRDREYSYEKEPSKLRIYAIGDSYTFGWFIDSAELTYPKIIEKKLNLAFPTEIINASQWGFNFNEIVNRYLWEGKQYHPDIVLLGLTSYKGDINNSKYIYRRDASVPSFIKNLRLYYLLFGRFFERDADIQNERMYLSTFVENSESWKEFSKRLIFLNHEVTQSGSKLVILLFPHIKASDPNAPYTYRQFNNALRKFGKENGVTVIDPQPEFEAYKNKEKLVLTPVDPHPSVEMHRLVANAFLKYFQAQNFPFRSVGLSQTVSLKPKDKLPSYAFIKNVYSEVNNFPWVYFEEKYGDSQTLPIENHEGRQTFIFGDKLIASNNTAPGPELQYYAYPKEKGKLIIPKIIHGYKISGFVKFFGLKNALTIPFEALKIRSLGDFYEIDYSKNIDIDLARIHLTVASNQVSIDPQNSISNTKIIDQYSYIQDEDSQIVTVPNVKPFTSYSQLDTSQGLKSIANAFPIIKGVLKKIGFVNSKTKLTPQARKVFLPNSGKMYVFVNGIYTPTQMFRQIDTGLELTFKDKIRKGTKIEFYVGRDENQEVTIKYEANSPSGL